MAGTSRTRLRPASGGEKWNGCGTPTFGPRFVVAAASRQPRIGMDYQPAAVSPTYTPAYLNPSAYLISIDAFPGMFLKQPKGDQDPGATNVNCSADVGEHAQNAGYEK
jgi:hypothetical protein